MDRLFRPGCVHRDASWSCEELGCDLRQVVARPYDARDRGPSPVVHWGGIACGDEVMRDSTRRDQLAKEHDVICFEMEAAGVMETLPCLVIRGIADYCDSHKNKDWQAYAAGVAAGFARCVLLAHGEEHWLDAFNLDSLRNLCPSVAVFTKWRSFSVIQSLVGLVFMIAPYISAVVVVFIQSIENALIFISQLGSPGKSLLN